MNLQTLLRIEEPSVHEPELIDVDMPFDAEEVEKATSRRYVEQLTRSDMQIVAVHRESRKKGRAALPTRHVFDPIDVDIPFSAAEVAALTCDAYAAGLGPSDMPVVGRWSK